MSIEYDFDTLKELNDKDPDAFEEMGKQLIEDFITSFDHSEEDQKRLRAVQWKIDRELEKHKNPTARYNCMVEMLYEQMAKFQEALGMVGISDVTQLPEKATVLEFKRKES